jgi:cob(I)alamin adenosyltransferase
MLKDHSYTCFQGIKIKKSEKIFDLLGELDKLNTVLGIARAFSQKKTLKRQLFLLQQEILRAGSLINLNNKDLGEFRKKAILLEKEVEKIKNPNLKEFVKPGETKTGAFFHFARVICRQVEREVVACQKKEYLPLVEFLNRLSSFLFWLGVKEEKLPVEK